MGKNMELNDVVCSCLGTTVKDIKDAIDNGAASLEEVKDATQVGTVCGICMGEIEEIVNHYLQK